MEEYKIGNLKETFEELAKSSEGLNNINEVDFQEILFSRDNIDDVIYTFFFTQDPSILENIINTEAICFEKLDKNEKKEAKRYAEIFYNTIQNTPIIEASSKIKPGDDGYFIAFIYRNPHFEKRKDERIYVNWQNKKENEDGNMFKEIMMKYGGNEKSFPENLRTSGDISITEKDNQIHINFSGDSKKDEFLYAPKILEKFERGIKIEFEEIFKDKEIVINY